MQVVYSFGNRLEKKPANDDTPLVDCHATDNGSFFYLPLNTHATSQYSGLHHMEDSSDGWDVLKTIYDFGALTIQNIHKKIDTRTTIITTDKGKITYGYDRGVFTLQATFPLTVRIDPRKIYDYSTDGRIITTTTNQADTIITYTKFTDGSCSHQAYTLTIILQNAHLTPTAPADAWEKVSHEHDRHRSTQPQEWYIYNAGTLPENTTVRIGVGRTQEHAYDTLTSNHENQSSKILPDTKNINLRLAIDALEQLTITRHTTGILAGLPWFFHWWTRDEAICLGAYIALERYDVVKTIITRQLKTIGHDGRVPNRFPSANLGSADGTGWLFVQLHKLITTLVKRRMLRDHFSFDELQQLKNSTEQSLLRQAEHHLNDDLLWSAKDETWMDTSYADDTRQGACIEIQALYLETLALYRTLATLTNTPEHPLLAGQYDRTLRKVQAFITPHGCADTLNPSPNPVPRPNLFLAAFIHQPMFSTEQWTNAFHNALTALWTDTGLATIATNHPLFCAQYDPFQNKSYHRGDTWYWMNNLAAIAMMRIDPENCSQYIHTILSNSTYDLLCQGALGHCAEVSSASALTPDGCPAQAWSAATLIELLTQPSMLK